MTTPFGFSLSLVAHHLRHRRVTEFTEHALDGTVRLPSETLVDAWSFLHVLHLQFLL